MKSDSYKIYVLIVFCLFVLQGISQQGQPDSLKKVLDSHLEKDSVRVINMFKYGNSISKNNPSGAMQVLNEALNLAKEIKWNRGIAVTNLIKSRIEGLEEKYDTSIESLLSALKIAEENHFDEYLFILHFDLSEAYRLITDYETAGMHAKKALDISITANDEAAILSATVLVAGVYAEKKQWDSASPVLQKAMKMALKLDDEYMQQQIISHQANLLIETKNYASALELYQQNLMYQLNTDNKNGIAWVYSVISRLFTDLNVKDSAYHYADQALKTAKKYQLTKETKDAYEALYICKYKFGEYKKALEYRLIYDSIYNLTYNMQSGQNAERARMELEQERKDVIAQADKIKKEAEVKRTRNLLFGSVSFFMLIAGFLYWNNRQKQKAKLKIEKAYSELKATQAQLIQSEKMASLGELTAGIAHEIQNPLNFVNNFSEVNNELIEELKVATNNEQRDASNEAEIIAIIKENSEKINHHGKRAEAIVKSMLQHSQTSSGKKEPTNINVLADEYLRLAYQSYKSNHKDFPEIKLLTDFDNALPLVNLIPQDIGRVLLNLFNNAFWACAERGRLENEWKNGEMENGERNDITRFSVSLPPVSLPPFLPSVTLTTKNLGDKIEIRIHDNGIGIPSNIIDKIFQPFFTTKPSGQGTGLGLSLAYDIVKAHGGEIEVNSKEGNGTDFIIQFPVKNNL